MMTKVELQQELKAAKAELKNARKLGASVFDIAEKKLYVKHIQFILNWDSSKG